MVEMPANSPQPLHPPAFSMVELLVVIGIIAIVISLLMPTLTKVRQQAQTTQCAAQLRQLGQAILLYANNNNGYTPTWSGVHYYVNGQALAQDGSPETQFSWTELLIPYFVKPDSRIYRCPAFADDGIDYFITAHWENLNGLHNIQLSQIKNSSCFILSGDCTTATYHQPPFGTSDTQYDDCDKDDCPIKCLLFFGENGAINVHAKTVNVLFADYHVARFGQWDSSSLTYSPHAMQDYDALTAN
jgi:type II secretory pathway pseudopilin PulG